MNRFTYFEQVEDKAGNKVSATSGNGRRQTYNITPEGQQAPTASLDARGPRDALTQAHWAGVVKERDTYSFTAKVNPPVNTNAPSAPAGVKHPNKPAAEPAQTGSNMVPSLARGNNTKGFL